jgi:hypothetical protein
MWRADALFARRDAMIHPNDRWAQSLPTGRCARPARTLCLQENNHKGTDLTMMIVILLLVALVLLDLLVHHWGVDSTDGIESDEWERRRTWRRSPTTD